MNARDQWPSDNLKVQKLQEKPLSLCGELEILTGRESKAVLA